jgi:hypothetical protein
MELILVELDAGAELDATECSEVVGAKLGGGTDLGSGCGRRMEARPRQEARVRTAGMGSANERRKQSPSRDGERRGRAESSRERERAVQSGRATRVGSMNEWMRMGS